MRRSVHWAAVAANEVAIAFDVSRDERLLDRILARAEGLGIASDVGVPVPEVADDDVREIFETPFRMLYRAQPARIDILALVLSRHETAWPA
jgi:plasmid stabilization system protein ParE